MSISDIANAIKSLFSITRSPAPQIPGMLMGVGATQKPGLSSIISCGNIVKALNKHGIPTGAMPDGSENKTVALVIAIVEEVYRAIKEDANVQIVHNPGSVSILATGANSGGPVLSQGININFSKGQAVVQ